MITVVFESEKVALGLSAYVNVYEDGHLIERIIAKVEPMQGANGYYSGVALKKEKID